MKYIFIIAFILFGLWLCIWLPFGGLHYETVRGEHTGFVTAVQRSGVIFKTGSAYLKTDTQSSQEDDYCVIDDEVYSQLQQYGEKKTHVNVYFFSWLSAGVKNCNFEGAVIYKVVPTNAQNN